MFYRQGDALQDLLCKDTKYSWKKVQQNTMENYKSALLMQHECFLRENNKIKLDSEAQI